MASGPSRIYGGVSSDERRAERSRRFKAAIVDVVASKGWTAVTVRSVAAAAGVGPRFFYESYADMTDLAIAAYDEISGRLLDEAITAIGAAPEDLQSRAHVAVAAIVNAIAADPRIGRFLLSDAPPIVERRRAFIRDATNRLVEQAAEIGLAVDRRQAEISTLVVMAGATELVRAWLDETLRVDPPEIAATISATLTNLLEQTRDPRGPGPSPRLN